MTTFTPARQAFAGTHRICSRCGFGRCVASAGGAATAPRATAVARMVVRRPLTTGANRLWGLKFRRGGYAVVRNAQGPRSPRPTAARGGPHAGEVPRRGAHRDRLRRHGGGRGRL